MGKSGENIESILLAHRLVTKSQLQQAREIQRYSDESITDLIVKMGFVKEDQLLKMLAARVGVAPWNLRTDTPEANALNKLPSEFCVEKNILPVQIRGDLLLLAMADPRDLVTIDQAKELSGMRIEPVLASETALERAIRAIHSGQREATSVHGLIEQAMLEIREKDELESDELEAAEIDTRPVVGLVNQIISDAVRMLASDIHIEPRANRVDVRFRLDGQLAKFQEFPRELLPMVVARIKILAELDIVEFRMPQDGRIAARVDSRDIDLRVSVIPNHHGQRVVLRIMDRAATLKNLQELGFSAHNLNAFRRVVHKPYGMVLVAGPTGSGKTTTLYAALNEVKDDHRNIMTCEDPVEYDIEGINQSQVNTKVGLTFATQLRAILRQDPDIVLVGEIRDKETAAVAISASMTGHLVLSTIHTNDAVSAIPRLGDIGVPQYLLGTSLIGVLAQRLVRCLCTQCRVDDVPTEEESAVLFSHLGRAVHRVYRPKGCSHCFGTGYRGRIAVGELLPVNSAMQRMIAAGAPVDQLLAEATKVGYVPMQTDALERVASGMTSFDEVARVVFLDDLGEQRAGHLHVA